MSNKLDELKKKYEELGKEIKRLENGGGRWRSDVFDRYYFITTTGKIEQYNECHNMVDNYRYKTRNYFKTEEEAQAYLDNLNTYFELMDLAEELNVGEKIDWNNESRTKYYIEFDNCIGILHSVSAKYCINFGQIYCLDENFLDKAIERIGEERLEKLFKNI